MGDPGWSWPFWKFGLTRDDLFGTLHDQYNTFPSSIQDPVAFHHDVLEVSTKASTIDEFYRLLADRKEWRLCELNESLESASFEIIGNPALIGTEQWQYAVQLFRTRSLDSLVRYFASYLPQNHPWHKPFDTLDTPPISYPPSISDSVSTVDSIASSHGSILEENGHDGPLLTEEPLSMSATSHLQLESRSTILCADLSEQPPTDHQDRYPLGIDRGPQPQTIAPKFGAGDGHGLHCHHEKSHSLTESSPPVLDAHESSFELVERIHYETSMEEREDEEQEARSQYDEDDDVLEQPDNVQVSETHTPEPIERAVWVTDARPSLQFRKHRSLSPSGWHPLSQMETVTASTDKHGHVLRLSRPSRPRWRESSLCRGRWRGTGGAADRVHKVVHETLRPRPMAHGRFVS